MPLPWQTQYTTETRVYGLNMVNEMDVGDALASATSSLTDLLTGVVVTGAPMLPSSPSVAGTTITQPVTGLTAGHTYRLVVTGAMGGSKLTSDAVSITCPW